MSRLSRKYSETGVYHILFIRKRFGIDNPKEISKMEKDKRNEILKELKQKFPVRQIQRMTDVSRGIISGI